MSKELMLYPMFIVELSEERVFKLLPMITPYPNSLLELSVLFRHQL